MLLASESRFIRMDLTAQCMTRIICFKPDHARIANEALIKLRLGIIAPWKKKTSFWEKASQKQVPNASDCPSADHIDGQQQSLRFQSIAMHLENSKGFYRRAKLEANQAVGGHCL
jgi:hypothetical protein